MALRKSGLTRHIDPHYDRLGEHGKVICYIEHGQVMLHRGSNWKSLSLKKKEYFIGLFGSNCQSNQAVQLI